MDFKIECKIVLKCNNCNENMEIDLDDSIGAMYGKHLDFIMTHGVIDLAKDEGFIITNNNQLCFCSDECYNDYIEFAKKREAKNA